MTSRHSLITTVVICLAAACSGSDKSSTPTPTAPTPIVQPVPAKLGIVTQPAGAINGIAFTTQPTVEVEEASGVRVATATHTVTASVASGTGTLGGTTSVAAVAGVATFTNLAFVGTGDATLAFSTTGLTAANSGTITVSPTYDALDISPATATVTLASAQTQLFVVRAKRGGANVAWPGGTVAFTLSSAAASVAVVNDSTVRVTAATLATTATVTLTARLGTVTSTATFSVAAQPAAVAVSIGATTATVNGATGTATFDIVVHDQNGAPITGLSAGNFTFTPYVSFLGNVSITPTALAAGPAPTTVGAASVLLIIDQNDFITTSDPRSARLAAAKQFALGMTGSDETAVYTFAATRTLRQAFTTSAAAVTAAIDALAAPSGNTATMYDAGVDGCHYVKANAHNPNKAILLVTEGRDYSTAAMGDVIESCAADGVRVYLAGFSSSMMAALISPPLTNDGYYTIPDSVSALQSALRGTPAMVRGATRPDRLSVTLAAGSGALPVSGLAIGTVTVRTAGGGTATSRYSFNWRSAGTAVTSSGFLSNRISTVGGVDNYTYTTPSFGFHVMALRYSTLFQPDLRVTLPGSGRILLGSLNGPTSSFQYVVGYTPTAGTGAISVRGGAGTTGGYLLFYHACTVVTPAAIALANAAGSGGGGGGGGSTPVTTTLTATGTFSASDCMLAGELPMHIAPITATAGNSLVITMTASSFDAYLALADSNGKLLATDDNSAGGTNPRITYTVPTTGTYLVLPLVLDGPFLGSYSLTVAQTTPTAMRSDAPLENTASEPVVLPQRKRAVVTRKRWWR